MLSPIQCAFVAGAVTTAFKTSKILWKNFVCTDSAYLPGQDTDTFHYYQLNMSTAADFTKPTLSTQLRLFVTSILINTHLTLVEGGLLVNQLCTEGGHLRPNQLRRLDLVRKLMVGVEVSGMLNDPNLCLQLVVMSYGILTPLVQHGVTSRPLAEVLLHCHAVLAELPEPVLVSSKKFATAALHHMIAAYTYRVGKVSKLYNY